jgi:hypothetical protein
MASEAGRARLTVHVLILGQALITDWSAAIARVLPLRVLLGGIAAHE